MVIKKKILRGRWASTGYPSNSSVLIDGIAMQVAHKSNVLLIKL